LYFLQSGKDYYFGKYVYSLTCNSVALVESYSPDFNYVYLLSDHGINAYSF